MEQIGARKVVPAFREHEADMPLQPWVDPENFNPGYLMRSLHLMAKQGAHEPWTWGLDYADEKRSLETADLDDGTLRYS